MRIAVIGDVHLVWDERDVQLLDASGYDLVLFVGDLAGYGPNGALRVARSIRKLRTPALVVPGNHDAVTLPQMAAEVFDASDRTRAALALGMERRVARLQRALGQVPLCGYSVHLFDAFGMSVLAARPHSMGGPRLSFRRYLMRRFGVSTLEQSSALLCRLLDQIPSQHRIVMLAHCGSSGLGATRDAIFGCDFRREQGDWGDPDLAAALSHARASQKNVLAVVAGHMHHTLRGGGKRSWQLQRDGVVHLNAACVPRRRRSEHGDERHHVRLVVGEHELEVEPVWL